MGDPKDVYWPESYYEDVYAKERGFAPSSYPAQGSYDLLPEGVSPTSTTYGPSDVEYYRDKPVDHYSPGRYSTEAPQVESYKDLNVEQPNWWDKTKEAYFSMSPEQHMRFGQWVGDTLAYPGKVKAAMGDQMVKTTMGYPGSSMTAMREAVPDMPWIDILESARRSEAQKKKSKFTNLLEDYFRKELGSPAKTNVDDSKSKADAVKAVLDKASEEVKTTYLGDSESGRHIGGPEEVDVTGDFGRFFGLSSGGSAAYATPQGTGFEGINIGGSGGGMSDSSSAGYAALGKYAAGEYGEGLAAMGGPEEEYSDAVGRAVTDNEKGGPVWSVEPDPITIYANPPKEDLQEGIDYVQETIKGGRPQLVPSGYSVDPAAPRMSRGLPATWSDIAKTVDTETGLKGKTRDKTPSQAFDKIAMAMGASSILDKIFPEEKEEPKLKIEELLAQMAEKDKEKEDLEFAKFQQQKQQAERDRISRLFQPPQTMRVVRA